jgi:hypothetical protein
MYSRCIWCTAALGANETLEHFPVGRRIAFDAAKGRLWVVCRKCERWNLTPLEERWEAIENAERRYRDTKKRVATDHIGLAKVDDGLELVRIGAPQRPEFAAWRYGDQFGRRWKRTAAIVGGVSAVVIGVPVAGPLFGLKLGAAGQLLMNGSNILNLFRHRSVVARVDDESGTSLSIRRGQLPMVRILPGPPELGGWTLRMHKAMNDVTWRQRWDMGLMSIEKTQRDVVLTGDVARRASATLLPLVNASGGSRNAVREATKIVETENSLDDLFRRVARAKSGSLLINVVPDSLGALPRALRLALEMAVHEDEERAVLEGELTHLERRWREAEEIAGIADDMFLPTGTDARLDALRASNRESQ